MRTRRYLALTLFLAACSATAPEELVIDPVSLEGWSTERIALPPTFAPTMPPGDELLLFAPGMFEAEAEDFWSYAFVMRVEETGLDATRLTELFEVYYDGLILAVAGGRGEDAGTDPAAVELERTGDDRYEAQVRLIEAFVTMQPLELRVLIDVAEVDETGTLLRVQASPQTGEHEIWRALAYAAANLEL